MATGCHLIRAQQKYENKGHNNVEQENEQSERTDTKIQNQKTKPVRQKLVEMVNCVENQTDNEVISIELDRTIAELQVKHNELSKNVKSLTEQLVKLQQDNKADDTQPKYVSVANNISENLLQSGWATSSDLVESVPDGSRNGTENTKKCEKYTPRWR